MRQIARRVRRWEARVYRWRLERRRRVRRDDAADQLVERFGTSVMVVVMVAALCGVLSVVACVI